MQEKEQKISPIKQRILLFADKLRISKREFYVKIGVSRGTLESKTGITEDVITKFLTAYPEINTEWLITGCGEIYKTTKDFASMQEKEQKSDNNIFITEDTHNSLKGIPLIPIDAVAGFNGNDTDGVLYADCKKYIIPEFQTLNVEYLIRVSGSSMYPKYSNGDILACRKIPEITFFQWGKIYVIDSNQGAMVKRIFECYDDDAYILCHSDNDKYPPFKLRKSEIRSLSIVCGVVRIE